MKLLNPGHELDGFEIESCMHAGGMAHVYKVVYAPAADGSRRRSEFPMAMKIPRMTAGDGAENIVSFEVELQILSELKGPHVPRFVAAGDLSRVPYLVMEYVEGQTLQHWLDRRDTLTVSGCQVSVGPVAAFTPDLSAPFSRTSVTRTSVRCWRWPLVRWEECFRRRLT